MADQMATEARSTRKRVKPSWTCWWSRPGIRRFGYNSGRAIWNGLIDRKPALIAQCTGAADVVDAVNFAREQGLLLSVKGGGHNVAGNAVNDGGLVIDLSPMRGVHVEPSTRTVRAQGGLLGRLRP